MTTYFAVEYSPIRPTTDFDRAAAAAGAEADRRQAPVSIYENGREILITWPAVYRTADERDAEAQDALELADHMDMIG